VLVATFLFKKFWLHLFVLAALSTAAFLFDRYSKLNFKPLWVSDGSLELLKWLALIFMVGDHVNKYLLDSSSLLLFNCGRLAMPLFALVIAYNLARPGVANHGYSIALRLAAFGLLASIPYILLGVPYLGFLPLNILFTFSLSVLIIRLFEYSNWLGVCGGIILFIVGGAFVEFWWPALLIVMFAYCYFVGGRIIHLYLLILATTSLAIINQNFIALIALPLFFLGSVAAFNFPRQKWFFYWFYPIHLMLILFWRVI
jgi:hypothetical protein